VHARIFARDDSVMVEDLGSTNGTYLNRRRITAPAELQRGDRVKIGKTVLELRK
jgi:pSer/pThr/pTyr-binding forkhead associated (FHA) protein